MEQITAEMEREVSNSRELMRVLVAELRGFKWVLFLFCLAFVVIIFLEIFLFFYFSKTLDSLFNSSNSLISLIKDQNEVITIIKDQKELLKQVSDHNRSIVWPITTTIAGSSVVWIIGAYVSYLLLGRPHP